MTQDEAVRSEMFAVDRLRGFTERVFGALGMPAADAALLADHLIWAELRGHSALGMRKIPQCVARLRAGGTKPAAEPVIVRESAAFVVVDAGDSFGQVAGVRAMRMAIGRARSAGACAVAVRNTTSAGALGYYAALAAEERMIGLAINNTPPVMTPAGGRAKVLGSQPFAVGSPTGGPAPLLLDTANSMMTWSKLHDYADRGEKIPDGVALDADGSPTVDPEAALNGIALPMGDHRGYGLALLWEVLTGVLAGGPDFAGEVTLPHDHGRPQGVSMFVLAVDPEVVMSYPTFLSRVDDLVDQVRSSRPVRGAERVMVPGERSAAEAATRERDGISISPQLVAVLEDLGTDLGVAWS